MIVVDTSALMAIVLGEPAAAACIEALEATDDAALSAGTLAEALIVAGRRGVGAEMEQLIDGLGFAFLDVTPAVSRRVAEAYDRWGKGVHPAGLNLGDCFAYVAAKDSSCKLLFVGDDFSRTDVEAAA